MAGIVLRLSSRSCQHGWTTATVSCMVLLMDRRLQAVQNDAARLITGARRRDYIPPVLQQLHWIPVRQRVQFKLSLLLFKVLQCLTDDCQLVAAAGRRQLRSSDSVTCSLPRTSSPARASPIVRLMLTDHICGTLYRSASVSLSSRIDLFDEFRADAATVTDTCFANCV